MGLGAFLLSAPSRPSHQTDPTPLSLPGNLYPYSISKLFQLSLSLLDPSLPNWQTVHAEAFALQTLVSEADFTYAPLGIAGTKATLQARRGYGGVTRLPLLPFAEGRVAATDALGPIVAINEVEERLAKGGEFKINGF